MEERFSSDFEAQRPAGGIPAARPSGTVAHRDWSCLTQQERDFGPSGVETGAAGKTVPCKPAAAGSPAAGVHGGLSRLRGWVCITPLFFFLKTEDLLRSRTEVPLAFTPAPLYIVPISPDFTSAVTI